MSVLPAVVLSAPARSRLAELEAVVERGLETFVEVGRALMEIRDGRLYRETHLSFEAYLDERWSMSRSRGYRLIDAARIGELVSPMGDIPANERQARELAPLLDDERELVDVWRELRAEYPGADLTADRVKRLVRRRLDRVGREDARAERLASRQPVFGDVELRHGDFRAALKDLEGVVDSIITDPPYEREWILRDAADFAAHARRMLKPSGTLVVMFGQLAHYELKQVLDEYLLHRWTGAYLLPGWHGKYWPAGVAYSWKPILIYTHPGATDRPEFLTEDVFVSEAADKDHHRWGQSESGTTRLVEAFSNPGDLVVDPFLGGGTTAVVAARLGRRFVGCDIDAEAVGTTSARLLAIDRAREKPSDRLGGANPHG